MTGALGFKLELLKRLPAGTLHKDQQERLEAFTAELDTLFTLGQGTNEPLIVRAALQRLLNNTQYFPEGWGKAIFGRLNTMFPEQWTDADGQPRIAWKDLGKYVTAVDPPSAEELNALGLGPNPAPGEIRRFLQADPALAEHLRTFTGHELRRIVEGLLAPTLQPAKPGKPVAVTMELASASASEFMACLERKLGYFAMVAIIAAVGAAIIIGTATAPITLPLIIWLTATLGAGTATIVLNCMRAPYS
jgi:hypothetical protein